MTQIITHLFFADLGNPHLMNAAVSTLVVWCLEWKRGPAAGVVDRGGGAAAARWWNLRATVSVAATRFVSTEYPRRDRGVAATCLWKVPRRKRTSSETRRRRSTRCDPSPRA